MRGARGCYAGDASKGCLASGMGAKRGSAALGLAGRARSLALLVSLAFVRCFFIDVICCLALSCSFFSRFCGNDLVPVNLSGMSVC